MKKIILLSMLVCFAFVANAQSKKGEQAILGQIGYQSNYNRVFLGAQYRYVFLDNFRLAPDVAFLFPNKKTTGLDVNVNVHYNYNIDNQISIYPLAGLNMSNNRFSGITILGYKTGAVSSTNWGFNLGGGVTYNLWGSNSFINLEAKYTFRKDDAFYIGAGYGIKF